MWRRGYSIALNGGGGGELGVINGGNGLTIEGEAEWLGGESYCFMEGELLPELGGESYFMEGEAELPRWV